MAKQKNPISKLHISYLTENTQSCKKPKSTKPKIETAIVINYKRLHKHSIDIVNTMINNLAPCYGIPYAI